MGTADSVAESVTALGGVLCWIRGGEILELGEIAGDLRITNVDEKRVGEDVVGLDDNERDDCRK
jgi:hypothetical protein